MESCCIQAPPSKSLSHRLMIAASLARGCSVMHNAAECDDTERTRSVLCAAGARIETGDDGVLRVWGMGHLPQGGFLEGEPLSCYMHESGTSCRLLTAVLAAGRGSFDIHGAPRLHERPMADLTDALQCLGADIVFGGRCGLLPFRLNARGLTGGAVSVRADVSGQFLSGLLLAAPLCRAPLCITLAGKKAVSWPYVRLTLSVLERHGIAVKPEVKLGGVWSPVDWRVFRPLGGDFRVTVMPGAYRAGLYTVEGDWSGAAAFIAAGLVGRRSVCVTGLCPDSLQADAVMVDTVRRMGGDVSWIELDADDFNKCGPNECGISAGTPGGCVKGLLVRPSVLHGTECDMSDCPDLLPVMAAAASFAHGETRFVNAAHLRLKECDRLSACARMLRTAGVEVKETSDTLTVYGAGRLPSLPPGTVFDTRSDHRMVMAAAVLGLAGGESSVNNLHTVNKSFPGFWKQWDAVRG